MKIAIYLDNVSNAIDNNMQYGIMKSIAAELVPEHQVKFIDSSKTGHAKAIEEIRSENYDILLTYNKTGTDLNLKDSAENYINLFSTLKKPHIAWLTEHPITFFEQYLASEAKTHYIFPNESHALFAQMIGLKGSYSCQMFGSYIESKIPKYEDRPYDICVAAQWRGPAENNEIWAKSKPQTVKFFNEVLGLQEIEKNRDSFTAYLAAAHQYGINVTDVKKHAVYIRELYWHARKSERIKLVQGLAESGLKILLVGGDEWKQILKPPYDITFVPPCDHKTIREYYKKCKIVATMNNFNGANERVFDAQACGAYVLCESSPNLMEIKNDNFIFYYPQYVDKEIERIKDIVKGDGFASKPENYLNINKQHTWHSRSIVLKQIMNALVS